MKLKRSYMAQEENSLSLKFFSKQRSLHLYMYIGIKHLLVWNWSLITKRIQINQ